MDVGVNAGDGVGVSGGINGGVDVGVVVCVDIVQGVQSSPTTLLALHSWRGNGCLSLARVSCLVAASSSSSLLINWEIYE